MHRVELTRAADEALSAMPDDVHEETLALIDSVADEREHGAGPMTAAGAVLRGRCLIVYAAIGGLLVVLDAGKAG
ncbi:hypothetical protein [Streptomyces sp. Je 1-369]|uniref:hypothetical protein n=1 Tax=Streptomyces sp. Je 1-369 TaxID=2966192 RepID=UPI0022864064|nr:hypothetical protein [Streptomyces sp. Je 1-369]WAL93959.1 hypothetical protein NOO62_05270 [Streptomyces sp. Je 1-369]